MTGAAVQGRMVKKSLSEGMSFEQNLNEMRGKPGVDLMGECSRKRAEISHVGCVPRTARKSVWLKQVRRGEWWAVRYGMRLGARSWLEPWSGLRFILSVQEGSGAS